MKKDQSTFIKMAAVATVAQEKAWYDKAAHDKAEILFHKKLAKMDNIVTAAGNTDFAFRVVELEKENSHIRNVVEEIGDMIKKIGDQSKRIGG